MVAKLLNDKLVIAISSRVLFNLDESHEIYEKQGIEAYSEYQVQHEDVPLEPGVAYSLVNKLLSLNDSSDLQKVEVILLSRNSADTGLRVFNSIQKHQMSITRAAFTSGESPYEYATAFGAHLFLSNNPEDVRHALSSGLAAASILSKTEANLATDTLKIAFDGDAVLFTDESERIYKQHGLSQFAANEKHLAKTPLNEGPFKPFLSALHQLQKDGAPIRTALVTARSAPAHERVIRTFREWDIRIDEALFLGGLSKGDFLKAFKADIFFDDQMVHCESANEHVTAAHVPHGVANE